MSADACGCVWERSEEHEVIVVACADHRAGMIGGERIGDIEDRARRVLDQELDELVIAAAGGRRVERIMPPDPTKRR